MGFCRHLFVASCYYAFVLILLEYCSTVWGLLLNVIFSFSSVRCIRWPGFALIKVSCRCVMSVMLLHCVCCPRLIRTLIIVCKACFNLLLSEFDILELQLQLICWSLEYQGVELSNLHGVFCLTRLVCRTTSILRSGV